MTWDEVSEYMKEVTTPLVAHILEQGDERSEIQGAIVALMGITHALKTKGSDADIFMASFEDFMETSLSQMGMTGICSSDFDELEKLIADARVAQKDTITWGQDELLVDGLEQVIRDAKDRMSGGCA